MIPPPAAGRLRPALRRSRAGFTLIELLAVMVIILLLAGLILNIAGNVQYKAAVSRATSEIKQMETAMESYKVDNGTYPRDNGTNNFTDMLNAQGPNGTPPPPDPATYLNACEFLFQQLSGFTQLSTITAPSTSISPMGKVYINFSPNQLMNGDANALSAGMDKTTYIADPFGFSYGYSTANQLAQDQNNTTANSASPAISMAGYNPTFDLWSTAGYTNAAAGGGKAYPASLTATQYNTLWAKNW